MYVRLLGVMVAVIGAAAFAVVRPDVASVGSDCELLGTGWLREPMAAGSALAIVAAGWWVARARPVAGTAVLLAGAASFAAHATAHLVARVLDGVFAVLAFAVVAISFVRLRPEPRRLVGGALIGGLGLTVWALTRTGAPLCDAMGPWGHAVWHLLVGAGVVAMLGLNRSLPHPGA